MHLCAAVATVCDPWGSNGRDGSSANIALVEEVKTDLEEMYKEVGSGKMTTPDLDRSIDFSNAESPRCV